MHKDVTPSDLPVVTVLPPDICRFLGVDNGAQVGFFIENNHVVVRKLDMDEPSDQEYYRLLDRTLTEWYSPEDDDLLPPWRPAGPV